MKQAKYIASALAVACAASIALAGCGTSNPGGSGTSGTPAATTTAPAAPVTMTLWHNATGDKGPAYWQAAVAAFEQANPNVTINITIVQNEDFDGKLQTAMAANQTPDIFLQRGGGKLADQVAAGQVADVTSLLDPTVKQQVGGSFAIDSLNGEIYGMPVSMQPEGFWYSKDLFTAAGITSTPTTMAELSDAVTKLQASGVYAIALGAQDAWPAAHWFYQFALRQCTQAEVTTLINGTATLTDPCWLAALQSLSDFNKTNPWNDGFLTTKAQTGAGSSAGLVANHKAGMELQGSWDPGVIGGLTPDKQNLPDLGFFTFPSVDGGQGDQSAMMAGADGYSCSAKAPEPACADFLSFIGTTAQQEAYSTAFTTIPANATAASAVTDPALQAAAQALGNSAYTLLWFDSALGQDQGNGLNAAVVAMLAGQTDPAGALKAMQTALKG